MELYKMETAAFPGKRELPFYLAEYRVQCPMKLRNHEKGCHALCAVQKGKSAFGTWLISGPSGDGLYLNVKRF